MNVFESILTNSMFILFPLSIYLIYNAYSDSCKIKKSCYLELALFTSVYMLIKFGILFKASYPTLMITIPLLIGFLNDKLKTNLIISIVSIIFLYNIFKVNIILIIVEYIMYFVIYLFYKKHNNTNVFIYTFILVRIFFIACNIFIYFGNYKFNTLIFMSLFSVVNYIIITISIVNFYNNTSSVIDYNSTLNELKKEKEIHVSLFKLTHEIKNPLAVCKGYFDMMETEEDRNKYLPIIKESIDRTLSIMDDFLSFTKIKCNMEDLDIFMLLEDFEDEMMPILVEKNIKAEFDIPDDEEYISGDYTRLKQVLTNVLKNSIESLKDNPSIKLKAYKSKKDIVIKIADNGTGMDSYTLEHIDNNFFTTKENGTGLGVPLSKEIIKLHCGNMVYDSKIGEGTIVTINLPINNSMA